MLVVRVELHSAITGKVTEIARMLMYNDGTGSREVGSYEGKTVKGTTEGHMAPAVIYQRKAMREGRVGNYRRLNLHVWHLVARMLAAMGYE